MSPNPESQQSKAAALLTLKGIVRLSEFRAADITAAAVSRLEKTGKIVRLARGLYQLPDAPIDTHHSLAEAAKLVPKAVICLTSALAFHGLTDQMPARIWLAIGPSDWRPRQPYPPMRFAYFPTELLRSGVERHLIEGTSVPIFSVAKTLADLFRYRRTVGLDVGIEGLKETMRQRKATPGEIAKYAKDGGIWKLMEPYVSTLAGG
jgi:predicted transcriptional regulator of viral defense system